MSEPHSVHSVLDLSNIDNAYIRIALRDLQELLVSTLQRQQMDLQAMLEMMIDRNIGSLAEFKLYLARQHESIRAGRIHDAIVAATHSPPADPPPVHRPASPLPTKPAPFLSLPQRTQRNAEQKMEPRINADGHG